MENTRSIDIGNDGAEITPFEWLTNFDSLSALLDPRYLFYSSLESASLSPPEDIPKKNDFCVLHVGCGSSLLGIHLCQQFHEYKRMINIDVDKQIIRDMTRRWEKISLNDTTFNIKWLYFDFKHERIQENGRENASSVGDGSDSHIHSEQFELVIDKSTIDCALCSDDATTGLLCTVYSALKPGGVYFVVSFHHVDFILPLLRDCPGVDWDVEHRVVDRSVDKIIKQVDIKEQYQENDDGKGKIQKEENTQKKQLMYQPTALKESSPTTWSTGKFIPNEEYCNVVNVFICRRRNCDKISINFLKNHQKGCQQNMNKNGQFSSGSPKHLNRQAVREHIHIINDKYFQQENPMVTSKRKKEIEKLFFNEMKSTQATAADQIEHCERIEDIHCNDNIDFIDRDEDSVHEQWKKHFSCLSRHAMKFFLHKKRRNI